MMFPGSNSIPEMCSLSYWVMTTVGQLHLISSEFFSRWHPFGLLYKLFNPRTYLEKGIRKPWCVLLGKQTAVMFAGHAIPTCKIFEFTYTVEPRYLELAYFELPLIPKEQFLLFSTIF